VAECGRVAFAGFVTVSLLCAGCGKDGGKASRDYAGMDNATLVKAVVALDTSGRFQKEIDKAGGIDATVKSGKVTKEFHDLYAGILTLRDVVCDAGVAPETVVAFMNKSEDEIRRADHLAEKVKRDKAIFPAFLKITRGLGKEYYGQELDPTGELTDMVAMSAFVTYCNADPEDRDREMGKLESTLRQLFSLSVPFVRSEIEKKHKENVNQGRDLYVSITSANIDREVNGYGEIWPRTKGTADGGKDIADKRFSTSTSYLTELLDMENYGKKEDWKPWALRLKPETVFSGAIPADNKPKPEQTLWSIGTDITDECADGIPVIVSANLDCSKLRRQWDGKTDADAVIPLLDVPPLRKTGAVVVYKNGVSRFITAGGLTLRKIYGGPVESEKSIAAYLTPHGKVDTAR
ncbi:MAG: hypothetical protein IJR99_01990, partial [Kiritimatiellae bacterium]|nr:hypothetical protein [Kiritimatiellia bacterium]